MTNQSIGSVPQRKPAAGVSRRARTGLVLQRWLDQYLSPVGVWALRRTKGGLARPWKKDVLILTTHGRKSGRERTVILQFFRDGEAMAGRSPCTQRRSQPRRRGAGGSESSCATRRTCATNAPPRARSRSSAWCAMERLQAATDAAIGAAG